MIENLAQLKKYFQNGGSIKMTWNLFVPNGKLIGVVRKPIKVQTNAIKFEGGSWLQYDKASNYDFRETGFDVFEVTDFNSETNRHEPEAKRVKILSYEYSN
jgi:hypothetical protein